VKNIAVILGTRPEAIKLAPVILKLREKSYCNVFVCNTEQQKELSNQTLAFFGIKADLNLDAMRENQSLPGVQAQILVALEEVYLNNRFDATIVQGDTMTVLCGALASYYNRVPVFHVEAGLRSYNLFEPFPEEGLRQMVSRITDLHFAPTEQAAKALKREGIDGKEIITTGNTVIDALFCLTEESLTSAERVLNRLGVELNDKLVLVTAHRRENHGGRLASILKALTELSAEFQDHQFVLPVHPNPNVRGKVYAALGKLSNAVLTEPLDYPELVSVMKHAKLILTDSGGIQEEAPAFGVPVLVMRYETERREGVDAGFAKLVGADRDKILSKASAILARDKSETRLNSTKNPYGDGQAAQRIEQAIRGFFK
jgi:UDP-N-acetylglucosamine 2-epimerase (non-hydrolysing)